jgi:hypothetical protein
MKASILMFWTLKPPGTCPYQALNHNRYNVQNKGGGVHPLLGHPVEKMSEPRHLATLWPFTACYWDSFTISFLPYCIIMDWMFQYWLFLHWHYNSVMGHHTSDIYLLEMQGCFLEYVRIFCSPDFTVLRIHIPPLIWNWATPPKMWELYT